LISNFGGFYTHHFREHRERAKESKRSKKRRRRKKKRRKSKDLASSPLPIFDPVSS
jgi:hypothetical protein